MPEISIQYAGHDTAPRATATKTGAYDAALGDNVICDTTGGAFTVTLPDVSNGQHGLVAVRLHAGTAAVTVDGYGAQVVDGAAGASVEVLGETRLFASNGAGAWHACAAGGSASGINYASATKGINTVAVSGAAQTIPEPGTAFYNDITLTADCTLTLPATTAGKKIVFVFRQGGVGGWVLTWPANTILPGGGVVPTAAAGAIDVFEAISVVEDVWMVYRPGANFS